MIKGLIFFLAIFILITEGYAQNYDESKVLPYTLPEILKTSDGRTVKNISSWEKKRRQEILTLFENHVYGQMPKAIDSINFELSLH